MNSGSELVVEWVVIDLCDRLCGRSNEKFGRRLSEPGKGQI